MRTLCIAVLMMVQTQSSRSAIPDGWPEKLADLFIGDAPAHLNTTTIGAFFSPLITVENFSRDQCVPVLKATNLSSSSVAASFLGTTFHKPCNKPQNVVILKFQFRDDYESLTTDRLAIRNALVRTNGAPCFEGTEDGHSATYWSDQSRALALVGKIDQESGYTIALFSRAALSPVKDEVDADTYDFWDKTWPAECQRKRQ